jgi:hypothetical protein
MTDSADDNTQREKRQREIRLFKGLARRGPRNRFEDMALRTLKNRHPASADSVFPT